MPRNTQLQNDRGSDGNLGPLDFQIFIKAKATLKRAMPSYAGVLKSGAQLLKPRQNTTV
jgi:hypothetical protein